MEIFGKSHGKARICPGATLAIYSDSALKRKSAGRGAGPPGVLPDFAGFCRDTGDGVKVGRKHSAGNMGGKVQPMKGTPDGVKVSPGGARLVLFLGLYNVGPWAGRCVDLLKSKYTVEQ